MVDYCCAALKELAESNYYWSYMHNLYFKDKIITIKYCPFCGRSLS